VNFAAVTFCVASQRVFIVVVYFYRLSPETFGYSLVNVSQMCVNTLNIQPLDYKENSLRDNSITIIHILFSTVCD